LNHACPDCHEECACSSGEEDEYACVHECEDDDDEDDDDEDDDEP
jgi:hypothetical protein